MKCEKCSKNIPKHLDYCPSCKIIELNNKIVNTKSNNADKTLFSIDSDCAETTDAENENIDNQEKKKKVFTISSLVLALIPYLVLFVMIIIYGEVAGWMFAYYVWTAALPIYIAAIITFILAFMLERSLFNRIILFIAFLLNVPPLLALISLFMT